MPPARFVGTTGVRPSELRRVKRPHALGSVQVDIQPLNVCRLVLNRDEVSDPVSESKLVGPTRWEPRVATSAEAGETVEQVG